MSIENHFDAATAAAAISRAPDLKACTRAFKKAITTYGIDAFVCGEVDLRAVERTVFLAMEWPEAWRKFYMETRLIRRDPLVDALKTRQEPFTWADLRREGKWAVVGTKGLQMIAEYGWTDGFVIPIPRSDHRFGLVSLYCLSQDFDPAHAEPLIVLSLCFHDRMRYLAPRRGFAMPPAGLSAREIEALRLITRGATDSDVARRLGIARSTAHEHIERAKGKLKAATRAEAVAHAVSLGIVVT